MEMQELISQTVSNEFTVLLWMLAKLIVFAMLLERALYFLFDYSLWRDAIKGRKIKAPITIAVAWFACYYYDFDILTPMLDPMAGSTDFGVFITALIVAGGSAGAMILFQDILKFSRTARERIQEEQAMEHRVKIENLKSRDQQDQ